MVRREIRNTNHDKRKTGRAAAFACALLGSAIMGCPKAELGTPATQDSRPVIVDIEKSSPVKESCYKELKRTKKEKMEAALGEGYSELKRTKRGRMGTTDKFQKFFEDIKDSLEESYGSDYIELKWTTKEKMKAKPRHLQGP